jgi:undecaprenyl-diphosphatase
MLERTLRRTVTTVFRYGESKLLLVLAAVAFGSLAFLKFASEILEGDTLAFDRAILLSLRTSNHTAVPTGPSWLHQSMLQITALGSGAVLTLVTAGVAGYLFVTKRPATALFVVGAVSGGALLGSILKSIFDRPRPSVVPHLIDVNSLSFPSGHAMNSAVAYLTLGALLAQSEPSRPARIYLVGLAAIATALVGISRVYLGVHWPTDVIAGWCVGATWAALCSMAAQRFLGRGRPVG